MNKVNEFRWGMCVKGVWVGWRRVLLLWYYLSMTAHELNTTSLQNAKVTGVCSRHNNDDDNKSITTTKRQ